MRHRIRQLLTIAAAVLLPLALVRTGHGKQQPAQGEIKRIFSDTLNFSNRVGVSPDGRWFAFAVQESPTRANLWVMLASGGKPVRLTEGAYWDDDPQFFPSGDRILFSSTRPASAGSSDPYLMALPFDAQTGRAGGAPKQVSFEPSAYGASLSADGRSIAYGGQGLVGTLKVIPAAGGNARVLMSAAGLRVTSIAWSRDGSSLYFRSRDPGGTNTFFRVAATGGAPVELFQRRGVNMAISSPAGLFAIRTSEGVEVVDTQGRVIVSRKGPASAVLNPAGFTPGGDALILVGVDVGAHVRVRALSGTGAPRDLTDGKNYPWALGWTADSKSVIYSGEDGGITVAPLAGGPARTLSTPTGKMLIGVTATHVLMRPTVTATDTVPLELLDLGTGQHAPTGQRLVIGMGLVGAGGEYHVDGEAFLYPGVHGDQIEVRSMRPGSPERVIRSFPKSTAAARSFAVNGSRVAFGQVVGDSVALMLADGPTAPARVIAILGPARGAPNCCRLMMAFSRDGRWIATSKPSAESAKELDVIEVPAQGRATNIRVLQVPADYWYEPRWLPDGRALTVIGGVVADADVILMPLGAGQRPVVISQGDTQATWGHVLSPDGQYVAYTAEVWRGGAIWRLDIPRR